MSRWQAPLVAAVVVFAVGQAGTVMLARNAEGQAAARRQFEAACDSYISKPFTHDQYLSAVAGLLTPGVRV